MKPTLEFRLHCKGPDGAVWKLWTPTQMVRFGPPGACNAEVQLDELDGLHAKDEQRAAEVILAHLVTTQRLVDVLVRAAVARDAVSGEAVLQPDGETVHAPDGDLGFAMPLSEWLRLGGRDLTPTSFHSRSDS